MNGIETLPEAHTNFVLTVFPSFAWSWVILLSMVLAEWILIQKVHDPAKKFPWKVWTLTHLPWLLLLVAPWFVQMSFPAPHDNPSRKLEVLFGSAAMGHLFLFAGAWLWGTQASKRRPSQWVGWVSLYFFFFTTLWTAGVCDLSGDEPHYLLMTQSILQDGDLDLTNNYANMDYRSFYHRGVLEPQGLEHEIGEARFSHHPLGTVLLMLPGFFLAGRMGASLTMALLAALGLFLTLRVMEESGSKGWPVLAVGAIGLLSSPLLLFSGLIFPEIPTACLVALALLLFLRKRWILMGLSLGSLIWMHNRNLLLVIPIFVAAAYEIWKLRHGWIKNLVKLYAGFKFPAFLLMGYFYLTYGVLTPLGAHHESFPSLFRLGHFWIGFLGLLMDQECGLWFHFPIFAISVMGGVLAVREGRPLGRVAAWAFGFYFIAMSFYENLGLTPATRYMVGVTPLLLLLMAPALEKMRKRDLWTHLTVLTVLLGVLMNWVLAAVPWMRYNKLEGENWFLKIVGDFLGIPLPSLEPSFNVAVVSAKSYALGAFWVGATLLLTLWFVRNKKKA